MDYKGIEAEVEKHIETLDEIDRNNHMWQFNVRRLKNAKKSGDQRNYINYLADMQAPLCLASRIESIEADGWSVLPASHEERMENVILKGKTSDGKDYKLVLEYELNFGNFIVTYVGQEETGRYPIFGYKKELFAEKKSILSGLGGLLKR